MEIKPINEMMDCWDNHGETPKRVYVSCEVMDESLEYKFLSINIDKDSGNYLEVTFFRCARLIVEENSPVRKIEDGLKEGDIIVNKFDIKSNILGICGSIIFLTHHLKPGVVSVGCTLEELISEGYTLFQEESEIVELTLQDISEGKGKGIPSDRIRIKE